MADVGGGSTLNKPADGITTATAKPKLRSRDYIESAMKRHKKRVSLDEDEWQAMIDFMAK